METLMNVGARVRMSESKMHTAASQPILWLVARQMYCVGTLKMGRRSSAYKTESEPAFTACRTKPCLLAYWYTPRHHPAFGSPPGYDLLPSPPTLPLIRPLPHGPAPIS